MRTMTWNSSRRSLAGDAGATWRLGRRRAALIGSCAECRASPPTCGRSGAPGRWARVSDARSGPPRATSASRRSMRESARGASVGRGVLRNGERGRPWSRRARGVVSSRRNRRVVLSAARRLAAFGTPVGTVPRRPPRTATPRAQSRTRSVRPGGLGRRHAAQLEAASTTNPTRAASASNAPAGLTSTNVAVLVVSGLFVVAGIALLLSAGRRRRAGR